MPRPALRDRRRCDLLDVLILPDGTRVMINLDGQPTEEEFQAETEAFYTIALWFCAMMPICMAIYAACKHGWI